MIKNELHPRSRHRSRYNFKQLTQVHPKLGNFVAVNAHGDESIDFANPEAVKALNQAILKYFYNISHWEIPPGYLCPPIPGRADYLHYAADLLADTNNGIIPRGKTIRILDIGSGANCIYPLIGYSEYGWSFVGTDIDSIALQSARQTLEMNGEMGDSIEFRLQKSPQRIFEGIIQSHEFFDFTLCNPPFHSSLEEAQEGTRRKWRNLNKAPARKSPPVLNFGGTSAELCFEGGERAFILRMIEESTRIATQCCWFSTLVSKESNLPLISNALMKAKATEQGMFDMAQGQKKSRIVAWTFLTPQQKVQWMEKRFK